MVLYHTPEGAVDFKEATDVLTSTPSVTLARIAEVFGREMHTIARARMEGANARRPPPNWPVVLAQIAEEHARELRQHADRLDHLSEELLVLTR
jgi:hypothetical protein